MIYNFSPRANDLLARAQLIAKKYSHDEVNTLHMLHAILSTKDSILTEVLVLDQNVDTKMLVGSIEVTLKGIVNSKPYKDNVKHPTSKNAKQVLTLANQISQQMDHSFIGTEHISLALICSTDSEAFIFLHEIGVDVPKAADMIKEHLEPITGGKPEEGVEHASHASESKMSPGQALSSYSVNLTELAKAGNLDPVIGRDQEIERVMQVLCRRNKNNPVLVGDPGVGKTAVVEGLCNMIAEDEVPLQLKDRDIYSLDLSLMVAGTKYRGQFEERMKQLMNDLYQLKDAIIFIDEIHMLVGAGNADGAMDAANILKPALSRGGICCIGTTTHDEYREFIETDGALERRFQKIIVAQPDQELTIDILNGLKHKYEEFHNVQYTDSAIETAVKLSDRYITDRFFPDKAIDVLDECAARMKLKKYQNSGSVNKIQSKITDCDELINKFISKDDYVAAATYRTAQKKYKEKKQKLVDNMVSGKTIKIDSPQIRTTISAWCGVPLHHLNRSESNRLLKLQNNINKVVIGQEQAVELICNSVIRGRADVGDPEKPIGSFLMMGPTGVGKTYLAKQLANFVYGDAENMVRVDMSELMESHSVSKLIGSPPGYVGYGEGGQLTELIRFNPYSVVLFDEIEKAHPDVMQLLLQLLDEGQLTDSRGVDVNFKNCIIIMTSNIGAEQMQRNHVVGFGATDQDNLDNIKKKLQEFLRPEFINRVDEIVMFNSLSRDACMLILNSEIKKFISHMKQRNVDIAITTKVKRMLLEVGFDEKFGARPLRRVLQSKIQTPLAKFLLEHHDAKNVVVDYVHNEINVHKKAPVAV